MYQILLREMEWPYVSLKKKEQPTEVTKKRRKLSAQRRFQNTHKRQCKRLDVEEQKKSEKLTDKCRRVRSKNSALHRDRSLT